MDCSPPGSSVHGILQARTLEWVSIPFSRGSSQPRDWTGVSWIAGRFFTIWATCWLTIANIISHDFMGQAGHMYWSGLAWLELDGLGCLVYMPRHWQASWVRAVVLNQGQFCHAGNIGQYLDTTLVVKLAWGVQLSRALFPNLWNLMPDDLRWDRCNNNRNKVYNKYNALEIILKTSLCPSPWNLHETGPWCQKSLGPLILG